MWFELMTKKVAAILTIAGGVTVLWRTIFARD